MKPIIGADADWGRRFARQRSDKIPLQGSARIVSRGRRIVETIGLALLIAISIWGVGQLPAVLPQAIWP